MPKYVLTIYVSEINNYTLDVEAADDSDAAYVANQTPADKWDWEDYIDADGEFELDIFEEPTQEGENEGV